MIYCENCQHDRDYPISDETAMHVCAFCRETRMCFVVPDDQIPPAASDEDEDEASEKAQRAVSWNGDYLLVHPGSDGSPVTRFTERAYLTTNLEALSASVPINQVRIYELREIGDGERR